MSRELYDYEKIVIARIATAISLGTFLDSMQVEPENDDASILQVVSPHAAHLGKNRVEMAFGVFEDRAENMKANVWVFGDENGNLRELDFHNFVSGVGMADLPQYILKIFPSSSGAGSPGT